MYPAELEELICYYKKFPGIGEKSAERISMFVIDMNEEEVLKMSNTLIQAKRKLKSCSICGCLTNQEVCSICLDTSRNSNLICLVEDYKNVFTFEKAGNYNGVYHVLNGLISPIDDITPNMLNITSLIKRVEKLENPEIIMALKSTVEGETTMLYIKKKFENQNVKISRLSYGISIGAELDYLDVMTLDKALEDRKIIS